MKTEAEIRERLLKIFCLASDSILRGEEPPGVVVGMMMSFLYVLGEPKGRDPLLESLQGNNVGAQLRETMAACDAAYAQWKADEQKARMIQALTS
jgi:hypothetical protein